MKNAISRIINWFTLAKPRRTDKEWHTQLGAHFEEILEMVQELVADEPEGELILAKLKVALAEAKDYAYKNASVLTINNRVNFLDALCDQIVTATGTAYMSRFDIASALIAVTDSNDSKFEDGLPVLNEHGKIMKGKYFKPVDLIPYV